MYKRFDHSGDHRERALTERLQLLVVDDDATFCHALTVSLRRMGYVSHFALDAKAGHQALTRRPYAICVVDARLADTESGLLRTLLRMCHTVKHLLLCGASLQH